MSFPKDPFALPNAIMLAVRTGKWYTVFDCSFGKEEAGWTEFAKEE
jgi:hypothetical protein